jgi:oligopeptide/dipeptide ABC transporter ATP-binding protein
MKQRVVGGIAIESKPRVMIADEPTTALDVTIQAQYLRLLKTIQEETKMAIVFITHDFGVVAKMCDRVAVMYAGRIVEQGTVREVFNSPAHPYTQALMSSVPKMDEKVDKLYSIEGQPPSLLVAPSLTRGAKPNIRRRSPKRMNAWPHAGIWRANGNRSRGRSAQGRSSGQALSGH